MNMPGLTAEASLYRSSAFYRLARASGVPAKREILPQLPIGFCMANCDRIQDDFMRSVCELRCFEQGGGSGGGGGGGGGGQHCTPSCGPCVQDPESPLGGFKTCIRANCDDYDVACRIRRPGRGGVAGIPD
jgi:hypothetical protein